MVLDQGVLKPRIIGKQVGLGRRPSQIKQGLTVGGIQRLIQTGKPNICIIRSLGGIGDVLMTTPTLRALKHKWPGSHLTYATDFQYMDGALKDVLLYNPDIDELLPHQVARSKEYDLEANVTSVCIGSEKPGAVVPNRIDLFAEHVGVSLNNTGFLPTYIVSEEEKAWAKKKLDRWPRKRTNTLRIGIQARSSTASRSWAIEKVRELALRLVNELGAQVIIFDTSHGHGSTEDWNITGLIGFKDYKIRQVAALINEMDLMITPDSGLMHIAGALNKKIVSIWAGTDPNARINHYPNAIAIARTSYSCQPCWYSPLACSKSYLCIKSIKVGEVFDATLGLLNRGVRKEALIIPQPPNSDEVALAIPASNKDALSQFDYCIVRDDGIGDIAACFPAFSAFKKAHPDKKIAFSTLAKNVELANLSGCFDRVFPLYSKWGNIEHENLFDARDLFEKNKDESGKGCYIESVPRPVAMGQFLGVDPDPDYQFPKDPEGIARVEEMLDSFDVDCNEERLVAIQLAGTCEARSWIESYYRPFVRLVKNMGLVPVILGRDVDTSMNLFNCVNLGGRLSVMEFNCLIGMSHAFVGVDSGGIHLAAANDVPFVAIFNAIPPDLRLAGYKNYRVVFPDNLKCAPCWDRGCKEMICMKQTTPEVLASELEILIEEHYAKSKKSSNNSRE